MSRLFISDLDGTLLDTNAQLSVHTRAHLARLLAGGLSFTVASARSIHSIAPILAGLTLTLPVIEFNGALITDMRTRRSLVFHAIAPQIAQAVMHLGVAAGIAPFISTYADGEQRLYPPLPPHNAGSARYLEGRALARDPRLREPIDCFATLEQPIVCVTLIGPAGALASIAAQISGAYPGQTHTLFYDDRYNPGWFWLTVQSANASKDHALREVAQICGVALEEVTAFGDEVNDIPMFNAAGRGIAVENAVDALKRVACEVIGPHHEDSVVRYLCRAYRE